MQPFLSSHSFKVSNKFIFDINHKNGSTIHLFLISESFPIKYIQLLMVDGNGLIHPRGKFCLIIYVNIQHFIAFLYFNRRQLLCRIVGYPVYSYRCFKISRSYFFFYCKF